MSKAVILLSVFRSFGIPALRIAGNFQSAWITVLHRRSTTSAWAGSILGRLDPVGLQNRKWTIDRRHQRIADSQQQEPRSELAKRDRRPALRLVRIEPSAGDGAEVFREPDEQRDEPQPDE